MVCVNDRKVEQGVELNVDMLAEPGLSVQILTEIIHCFESGIVMSLQQDYFDDMQTLH